MRQTYQLRPIGWIRKTGQDVRIELDHDLAAGLLGLAEFSHIVVCYWFHENDTAEERSRLQVHPRKDPANPLTGVFATHAPVRPNLIALSVCRVVSVAGATIHVEAIDARDGSPVIDIKCYIPDRIDPATVRLPDWV
ncbi:MAG TPA: tRNA (N6-threonylcarbamoyladenosine(37)-N6)-methyltransferase TrmO [Desulfosarcina sp.]|nr:tRNA (N6-threonylcarbamoyladenosine(37)-N6)-methyltransferase TrmO [Desulfosarcina sp.]